MASMDQFMPRPQLKIGDGYNQDHIKYESEKWRVASTLDAVSSCLGKCSVNMSSAAINAGESKCLSKCYNKYFDCQLLVDKEMEHHTFGNPYSS